VTELAGPDWSFSGQGAIGEELAPLLLRSLACFEIEPGEVPALEEAALASYLDGLRAVGWQGDPDLVQFGYRAAAALRSGLGSIGIVLRIALDDSLHPRAEQLMHRSIGELFDNSSQLFEVTLKQAEQAQQLLTPVCARVGFLRPNR